MVRQSTGQSALFSGVAIAIGLCLLVIFFEQNGERLPN
jgi:hypothetical protein